MSEPSGLSGESDERLLGRYAALARLSTSVRFNRPQMEIIEDDAADVREELERRGKWANPRRVIQLSRRT